MMARTGFALKQAVGFMGKSRISLLDNCDNIINPPAPANRFSTLRVNRAGTCFPDTLDLPSRGATQLGSLMSQATLWSGIMRSRKAARETPAAIAHLAAGAKEK